MAQLQIQSNYFLVEADNEDEEKVQGGIILPGKKKRERLGTIVEVGNEQEDERVVKGARVMYNIYGGTKLTFSNKTHYLLKITDLYGFVEEN